MSLPYMFSHMVRAFLNWRVDQTEHYSPDIVMDVAKKSGAFRKPKNLKKDLHVVENTQKTK